jgi:hypothetical protein
VVNLLINLHGIRVIVEDTDLHGIIQATHIDDIAVDLKEGYIEAIWASVAQRP